MKLVRILTGVIVIMSLFACGGGSNKLTKENNPPEIGVPDWFLNTTPDPNFFFSSKTATSRDMQLAYDSAIASARGGISTQVEAHVKTLEKKFVEEVGGEENSEIRKHFSSVIKIISKTSLVGSKVTKKTHYTEGNRYRAFVQVEYALGAANKALIEQLKMNKVLYDEYKATKAYEELDKETADL